MAVLQNVESLVALLSKVVDKSSTGRTDPVKEDPENPLNAVKDQPRRLCAFLDALAFLMVSEPEHQVFAISLRAGTMDGVLKAWAEKVVKDKWLWSDEGAYQKHIDNPRKEFIEVMIASNDAEVAGTKMNFLRYIWTGLRYLSGLRQSPQSETKSPRPVHFNRYPPAAHRLIRELLGNSWAQIRKQFISKYDKFTAIKVRTEKFASNHPWFEADEYVRLLYETYIEPEQGKPATDDGWKLFWMCLFQTMEAIEEFVRTGDQFVKAGNKIDGFGSSFIHVTGLDGWDYRDYLSKIASIPKSILTIWAVVCSPQCRPIFNKDFVIRSTGRFSTGSWRQLPSNENGWLNVFRGALRDRNNLQPANEPLELLEGQARAAIRNNIGTFGPDKVFHAEVKVAAEIIRESNCGYKPGFSYIGVSKLCCRPCHELLMAMRRLGVHFVVRGSHGKCYYPWTIPWELVGLPEGNELLKQVQGNLAIKFCDLCQTDFFQVKSRGLRPDDTNASLSSGRESGGPSVDDPEFSNVLEQVRKVGNQLRQMDLRKK